MAMADDAHDRAEELLPWYATGRLEAADRALVEAHLACCASCRQQLNAERALIERFQALTPDVDSGWARLRQRLEPRATFGERVSQGAAELWHAFTRPVIAGLAAAQVAFVAIAAFILQAVSQPAYVALGAAPTAASANIVVMFNPQAREADLRGALAATGGTLVGGPTEADAYLVHVPADARPSALKKLSTNPSVTLAQPIDGPAE
jgi:anti-sigma factor RsiW